MPIRRQAITLTNDVPFHWRICAAQGGEELKHVGWHCLSALGNIDYQRKPWGCMHGNILMAVISHSTHQFYHCGFSLLGVTFLIVMHMSLCLVRTLLTVFWCRGRTIHCRCCATWSNSVWALDAIKERIVYFQQNKYVLTSLRNTWTPDLLSEVFLESLIEIYGQLDISFHMFASKLSCHVMHLLRDKQSILTPSVERTQSNWTRGICTRTVS